MIHLLHCFVHVRCVVCIGLCLQLAHSEQIKVAAGKEAGEEDQRRRATAEKERQEKERQQNKEKLHSWKVGTVFDMSLFNLCCIYA